MWASFFTWISTDVFIQIIADGMHCILRLYSKNLNVGKTSNVPNKVLSD